MPAKSAKPAGISETEAVYFRLFNEIGIIAQLSASQFARVLPEGLTPAQFSVLNHGVRLGDGWTPARLAAAFQVTRGTMTSTLQKLEGKGLIRIDPDAEDARSKRVYLTPAGRAVREAGIRALGPLFARLPQGFSPSDAAAILPELERLRLWLDANR